MMRMRQAARALMFVALATAGASAFAQRTPVPLMDFVAIPVEAPTTTDRVALAWRLAASRQAWDAKLQPDGTLGVSAVKDEKYPIKLRVTFDAKQYSVNYVESEKLNHRPAPSVSEWNQSRRRFQDAAASQAERYKDSPDTPYAVKRDEYIHPSYEFWVRELLVEVRQQLKAPTSATLVAPVEEAGVRLFVPINGSVSRAQSRSVTFKDAFARQWLVTRFDQPPTDPKAQTRGQAAETLKAFRDEANRRRLQPSESPLVIVDEALPNAGTLVAVGTQVRRGNGREVDSHVDFRMLWPGRLPDGQVQGTVDWAGDLQPSLPEVLEMLRRIEPVR